MVNLGHTPTENDPLPPTLPEQSDTFASILIPVATFTLVWTSFIGGEVKSFTVAGEGSQFTLVWIGGACLRQMDVHDGKGAAY